MQVTKGTWRMREQCVPGSSPTQEPGNEANLLHVYSYSATLKIIACKVDILLIELTQFLKIHLCPQVNFLEILVL